MYTLDANIYLRDLDSRDPEHSTCHALIERLHTTATLVIVPLIVLPEIAGAISREVRDIVRARVFTSLLRTLPYISL